MPFATTDDGIRLHYEETGTGVPPRSPVVVPE